MTTDEVFNERLIQLYGNEQITQQPKYRVVWSGSQTEKRYGKYDLLSKESGIWLGIKQGIVEIQKYWYLPSCWVLERVEPNLTKQDTIYEKWTYEPILPFLDKGNNVLPLSWKPIEFLCSRLEHAEREVRTEEEDALAEEKRMQDESERVYGLLDKPESTKPLPTFDKSTLTNQVLFKGK